MIENKPMSAPQLLGGKRGVVMGVANEKSIAWNIALSAHNHGAELAFSYQSEVLLKRLEPLANSIGCNNLFECDVSQAESVDSLCTQIKQKWGSIDFIVHSIAFSDKNELRGKYVDTTLANFLNTMSISCFSFTAIAKKAEELMPNGGSLITLTYYGAEKTIPNYNVMGVAKAALECSVKYLAADLGPSGIRVNAISAGPIKTLAAAGIGGFNSMLRLAEGVNPLRRNTTTEDVGGCSTYLLSDLSKGTTGEIIHVDCGYHIVGMPATISNDAL